MSLRLMQARIKQGGYTPREEFIHDGQELLKEELEHDSSYAPSLYIWKYNGATGADDRPAKMRIYGRTYSSLNGNYQKFLTTYDNPIYIGDYIHDTSNDTYWLVNESFNVNDIHYEGKMVQCNYLLKWQADDDSIIERYANIVSASKYDTGHTGNSYIILTSNNFTVLVGYSEEAMGLDEQKVFIDLSETNPTKVFDITRSDDVLFNAMEMGGLLSFIASKAEFNPEVDNQKLRICNYRSPAPDVPLNETVNLFAKIMGTNRLIVGYPRTFYANITYEDGTEATDCDYTWNIDSDFDVTQEVDDDNNLILSVDDDDLCGSSFILQLLISDEVVSEIEISIIDGM